MALDGIFLHLIKDEIAAQTGSHIDKIYQPSKDELVFLLRGKNGAKRLLICAGSGRSRIHFTLSKYENPATPPMFCMLLRKHLGSARLVSVEQNGNERILTLVFSASNEMGDIVYPRLICEMIGAKPNIILTDESHKIIAAARYSDLETASRIIAVGALYTPPESQNKYDLLTLPEKEIANHILSLEDLPLSRVILNTVDGFSPLVSAELAFRSCGDIDKIVYDMTAADKMNLNGQLCVLKKEILSGAMPTVLYDQNNIPKDFSFCSLTHLKGIYSSRTFDNYSAALDEYYNERDRRLYIKRQSEDIFKILNTLYSRTIKKSAIRMQELEKCKNREHLRVYGELIKANLYRLKNGMTSFESQNYYDENLATVTVPLNPAFSPAANADRYFKEYKKSYTAEKTLEKLIKEDQADLNYFESVLDSLSHADTLSELNEIRDELCAEGYLKQNTAQKKQKAKKASTDFRRLTTPTGLTVLVGKNNKQNDTLTLSFANKTDLWFHVKDIAGSHTVLVCQSNEPDDQSILFAATAAAYYSSAKDSSKVAVDCTKVKYVKKPSGAKPGMVIYTNQKTFYVDPTKFSP